MHHRIKAAVTFTGLDGSVTVDAIIDTGATISMIPWELAAQINVHRTDAKRTISGVHGQTDDLPIAFVGAAFPQLENKGAPLVGVVVTPHMSEALIGMDVMSPLGISIDTGTATLKINDTILETFKTVSAGIVGVGLFGGLVALVASAVEGLSEPQPKRRSRARA